MHPILIQTAGFTLHTFWIFMTIALISATLVFIKFSVKNGLKIQFISEHSWKLILVGLLGARIAAVFINYQTYFYEFSTQALSRLFYFWDKGLNVWGGTIAFIVYFYYLCKQHNKDFFKWMDTLVPAVILGLSISHIGAFFEGINYGRETNLPWGVNFESSAILYAVPIHPTQIYAALYSAVLYILLRQLLKNKKIVEGKSGKIALIGIGSYNALRFLEEFFRGDLTFTLPVLNGIRVPQIIALTVTITAGIFYYIRYNAPTKSKK